MIRIYRKFVERFVSIYMSAKCQVATWGLQDEDEDEDLAVREVPAESSWGWAIVETTLENDLE